MLNCEQFRLLTGADPEQLSLAVRIHRLTCLACARYLREMRHFNRRIRQALRVADPAQWIGRGPLH